MKPRNREINIFNLSMLDVISGALGAFLIIMIILFPYYKKETIDLTQQVAQLIRQLEETRQQAEAARQQAETARQQVEAALEQARQAEEDARQLRPQLDAAQQAAAAARRQLSKTFLVIHISWETKYQDVDLHVVDPAGVEFYYDNKTHSTSPGLLSVDTVIGPGNEIWEVNDAPPGDYKIYAQLFGRGFTVDGKEITNNKWPTIKGRVSYKDGTLALPEITLQSIKNNTYIATVTVESDGGVRLSR